MALTQQQEKEQQAALYLRQNRRELGQGFREDLMKQSRAAEEDTGTPPESVQKSRLALLKASSIKQANAKAGGALGASVGGTIGSVIPVVGTGVGAFLGRFVGKKMGIVGIILFALLSVLFLFVIFIAILKGMCETTEGQAVNTLIWAQSFGATDICAALQ